MKTTFFKTVAVDILANGGEQRVMCMMDSGSSVTLIHKQLATQLKLRGLTSNMALSWTDGGIRDVVATERVSFCLRNPSTMELFEVQANTYEDLRLTPSKATKALLQDEGFVELPISVDNTSPPLILVGQDNCALMRTLHSWEGTTKTLFAVETPLGFTLEGEVGRQEEVVLVVDQQYDPELLCLLMDHINSEKFGLQDDSSVLYESDEASCGAIQLQISPTTRRKCVRGTYSGRSR